MSDHSTTEAATAPPRRWFGLPRLADVRIRNKLGLILIVPVVALVGIAGMRLFDSSEQALESESAATLASFTTEASSLLYSLQSERLELAVQQNKAELSLGDREDISQFDDAAAATDNQVKAFRSARQELPDESSAFSAVLDDTMEQLDKPLDLVRKRAHGGEISDGDIGVYNATISWLRNVFEHVLEATNDAKLSRDLRAAGLITAADEYSEQMRLLMLQTPDNKSMGDPKFRSFLEQLAGRDYSMLEFHRVLSNADAAGDKTPEADLGSQESSPASDFESTVISSSARSELTVDHKSLLDAYDDRHKASSGYVNDVQERAVEDANTQRDTVVQKVLIEITVVLITLVLAVVLALVIARAMVQSLRHLREGALQVAHVGLPQAVAAMRESDEASQRTPSQVVAELGNPLDLDSQDEIGTVAGAFNTVHQEAVRIAAEQAALRASVAQMFVNLARRSQNLVDRLIGHLDRLERGEEDPDRLAELFQLDHLATRMRRNDENLLVLAGADSTRVERNSAQVGDVLRAAQSEVEQYTRVEFGTVSADAEVEAGAINDIVHLVAELLDNATSFSPPDSAVVAEARQSESEIYIRITDRGIGISPEQLAELNQQLAAPTDVDIAASRMMGLVVVARLANRHNLRVTLLEGAGRQGTIAEIVLPPELLAGSHETSENHRSLDAAPTGPDDLRSVPPYDEFQPLAPMPRSETAAGPSSLFEPLASTDLEQQPGTNGSGSNGAAPRREDVSAGQGVSFYPGGDGENLPRRRLMEVTGEIVADDDGSAHQPQTDDGLVMPMIRLDAAPLPGDAPEVPGQREAEASAPPSWPEAASHSRTSNPVAAAKRLGAMDETMELPIFREVESAWFKASTPTPRPASSDNSSAGSSFNPETMDTDSSLASATSDAGSSDTLSQRSFAEPQEAGSDVAQSLDSRSAAATDQSQPGPSGLPRRQSAEPDTATVPDSGLAADRDTPDGSAWHTSADRGWEVAAEMEAKSAGESTGAGLPKRRPMERLVPGSVESPEPEDTTPKRSLRRDPEGVRGLLSAYHRGVQRGRGNDSR